MDRRRRRYFNCGRRDAAVTGRIQRALSGFYYVKTEDGALLTCKARGRFRREGISPLVGDEAVCSVSGSGEGRIDELLPRRNYFERPSVANIDQMVIVCSQAIPKTDPHLVDRMTAIAALKHCEVLICINKCDLAPADLLRQYYVPHCVCQRGNRGWNGAAARGIAGKTLRCNGEFRRWKIEHSERT